MQRGWRRRCGGTRSRASPLKEEKLGQDIDPAEFPPLPEANTSRKGRKKKSAEGPSPAIQGPDRPQKDTRARKPKRKEDDTLARPGRPPGRDDLSSVACESARSNSRELEMMDVDITQSDDDTMDLKLPLDAQVVSHRLNLSRTGPGPYR